MPGGYYSTFALDSTLCKGGASPDCGKGGTWTVSDTYTPIQYQPVSDNTATSGEYLAGTIYPQNLNVNGDNRYTVLNASLAAATIGNQTLPSGNQIDIEIGFFSLGADDQQQEFTTGLTGTNDSSIKLWIMPGYFYAKRITQSNSFSLHIGSTAFNYPGSMYFGGYDKGRAIGPGTTWGTTNPPLQDIVLGVETGGSPFSFGKNMSSLLISNTSTAEPITVYPEPIVPGLYLPKQTCDKLATILPIKFDSSGYYLWDTSDPTYANITTSAAYLGFVFPPSAGGTEDVTIKVPLQLLVLNLTVEASGQAGSTPYFPCMPYNSTDGNYPLGRAFLQAALFGKNYGNKIWFLAQAPGPGAAKAGLGLEPHDIADSATTLDYYPDDSRFAASWSQHWTPLADDKNSSSSSGGSSSSSSGSLSTGAMAGIGVGAAAIGLGLVGIIIWFILRRRKSKTPSESDSVQEPMAAAHYSDDPRHHNAPDGQWHSPGQQSLQPHGSHPPYEQGQPGQYPAQAGGYHQSAFHENYAPYKGDQQGHELSELSGSMRNPAQELPGHAPQELEAPYKQERVVGTAT